jgi:membrane protein implicated in regulation of membrane protease activity
MTQRRAIALLTLGTLATVFWVNAPLLAFPYVQDDWQVFGDLSGRPLGTVIWEAFSPKRFFYRPLVGIYMALMYHFFSVSALVSRIALTVALAANALLVGLIARELTKRWAPAICVAVTYAAATSIHLDPLLMQNCGSENFGAGLCGFAALWLFLRGRSVWSAALYATALLFKESAVVLPGLLAAYAWLVESEGDIGERTAATLRRIWPHAIVFVAYAFLRWSGGFAVDPSPKGPYYVLFWGPHLGRNFAAYLRWTMEAILPLVSFRAAVVLTLSVLAAAILLEARAAGPLASPALWARGSAQHVFLAVWFVVGLLPVLPMPNHTYRYYAELALPAAILAWWQAVFAIARRLCGAGFPSNVVAAAVLFLVVVLSWVDVRQRVATQRDWDGSNQTLERTHVVTRIQPLVRSRAQQLAGQTTLLIDGLEVWSFAKEHGPRLWSNNPDLQVFSTAHLQITDGRGARDRGCPDDPG